MASHIREISTVTFGRGDGGSGSPAAVVVSSADLDPGLMGQIAGKYSCETTFVSAPSATDGTWKLRFFLQGREMSMCVHGTIGAFAALARHERHLPEQVHVSTPVGVLAVKWKRKGAGVLVCVDQLAPTFGAPIEDPTPVLRAIGARVGSLDSAVGPVQTVSVSRAKIMIPIADVAILDSLSPRFEALEAICRDLSATGVYAFTTSPRAQDRDVDARQFPSGARTPEDPATGVAAAALAAYLKRYRGASSTSPAAPDIYHVRIGQGDAIGVPCMLEASAITNPDGTEFTRVCGLGFAVN